MKKKLMNNLSLKILSVILGALLWFVVVIIADPVVTETIEDVTITTVNEELIGDNKASYIDKGTKIKVYVTGKRSVVSKLTAEDIVATADYYNLTKWNEDEGTIPIELKCKASEVDNNKLKSMPRNMKITLEDRTSEDFVIKWSKGTSKATTGYEIGTVTISPSWVTVSGPESIVGIIDKVEAIITESNTIYNKQYSNRTIQVYDRNGDQFTDSQMEMLEFTDSDGNAMKPIVDISVELWEVVEGIELAVNGEPTTEPVDGYRFAGYSITPKTISVAGTEEALAALEDAGNIIYITTDLISLTDRHETFDTKVENITANLPADIKLVAESSEVIITTMIEELDTRTVQIAKGDIKVIGLNEELFKHSIANPDYLNVVVRGAPDDLDKLDTSKIVATIDLSKCTEDKNYQIPVAIKTPESFECVNESDLILSVKIIKNESSISTESSQ